MGKSFKIHPSLPRFPFQYYFCLSFDPTSSEHVKLFELGRGEEKVKHVLDSKMQPLLAAREREKELRGRGWIVSQVRMLFKCKDNSDNSRFIHFSEVREQ